MSDVLAGLPIPGRTQDRSWEGMVALSNDDYMIQDEERFQDILIEELDHMTKKVLPLTIAQHHHLQPGQEVVVSKLWNIEHSSGKFPLVGVIGYTTERGFRAMVRAMIIGHADDIGYRQYKGRWCLKDYSILKTYDGDSGIRVIGNRVVQADQVVLGEGMPSGYTNDPITNKAVTADPRNQQAGRRVIYRIDMEFVDIAGSDRVLYREGKPDDGSAAAAMRQSSDMTRLVDALRGVALANANAGSPAAATPDIKKLAEAAGLTIEEFMGAITAYKQMQREAAAGNKGPETVGEAEALPRKPVVMNAVSKRVPEPLFLKDEVLFWKCPHCEFTGKAIPVVVSQHLGKHVRASQINARERADGITAFDKAIAEFKG